MNELQPGDPLGVEPFGGLLLDIYRLSRETQISEFQQRVLERLRELVPFDSAWWGIVRTDGDLHSSFPFHLPEHFAAEWECVKFEDDLADAVFNNLGVCVSIDFSRTRTTTPAMRGLLERFNIHKALCVMSPNPAANLRTFLSLYRGQSMPVFSERERLFTQLAMPHVWATWTSNWISQVEHIRAHSSVTRMAHGIADRRATLHTAEPALIKLLQREWPQWIGPTLPIAVAESVRSGLLVIGEHIAFRALPVGGLYLIEASERSAIDRLTARELTIAEGFGRGRSYKELALMMAVAPATIRAHLRTIYAKLGVTDKAELAMLLTTVREDRPRARDHASACVREEIRRTPDD